MIDFVSILTHKFFNYTIKIPNYFYTIKQSKIFFRPHLIKFSDYRKLTGHAELTQCVQYLKKKTYKAKMTVFFYL